MTRTEWNSLPSIVNVTAAYARGWRPFSGGWRRPATNAERIRLDPNGIGDGYVYALTLAEVSDRIARESAVA